MLGLRPATSPTRQGFLIGTALTRARSGSRTLVVAINPRARRALVRADRRITVNAYTRFRTPQGQQRIHWTRLVLPAGLR